MSHKSSQVKALLNDDVLAIGISPEAFTAEELAPFNLTVEKLAAQVERGWAAIQAAGVVGELCSVSKDPDEAEAEIRKRFAQRSFGLATVGSGVRLLPENTVLFERIVNVLVDLQPDIRLGFATGPKNMLEAIRRWLDR
ncbi:hypothetical protein ACFYO2_41715 [Streptomyces sp. NPDC006602]|uniref:hypothetical protein n=1 Tax=Streptomyces sp. NPDC006602 TaxID=3364751 RepID=UPI00369FEE0B